MITRKMASQSAHSTGHPFEFGGFITFGNQQIIHYFYALKPCNEGLEVSSIQKDKLCLRVFKGSLISISSYLHIFEIEAHL